MLFVTIKLTVFPESLTKYLEGEKYLLTFEKPEENPHYHMVIDTTKIGALRNAITRHTGLKGRDRQVSTCKNDQKSIIYILKEDRIIHNSLVSQEDLINYKKMTYQKDIKKLKPHERLQSVCDTYEKLENIQTTMFQKATDEDKFKIIAHIYEHITDTYNKPFNKPIVEKLYFQILQVHYNEIFHTMYLDKWVLEQYNAAI